MRRSAWRGAGALVGLFVLLVTAGPAAASGGAGAGPIEGRLRTGREAVNSTNWSGYAAYGATFTRAVGSWTQPTADCSSVRGRQLTLAAFWVGLDGYQSNTVEQTGTEADCEGHRPIYYAWYELYPQRLFVINEPVKPEDKLIAEVTQGTLKLEDKTAGWHSEETFLPGSLAFSSAEWIAEAPSKSLTDFATVSYSGASASSAEAGPGPIDDPAWKNDRITVVNHGGPHATVRAEPGGLEGKGSAFSIKWRHS